MSTGGAAAFGAHDRRRYLRVPLAGQATVTQDNGPRSVTGCCEFSIGGAILETDTPWPLGTEIRIESVDVDGLSFELGVYGTVVRVDNPTGTTARRVAVDLLDMDAVVRGNVQALFSHVVSKVLPPKPADAALRFDWVFRDVAQLAEVCRTLLTIADLADAWTHVGPSEMGRSYLAMNGRGLTAPQQRILTLVWKLWSGSLDVLEPSNDLPPGMRGPLMALKNAMTRGPNGIDVWLATEKR